MTSRPLMRVLLVEDDPDTQFVVRAILEDMNGLVVERSGSGHDAIKRARSFNPDLILLDIVLPDMDGLDILRELRKAPETAKIPAILCTAFPPNVSEYKDLGVLHVISKPFDPIALSAAIDSTWKSQ